MAGSNATTRGVPRRILQGDHPTVPVIGASQIPTIQYSSGNARALQQFSRDLFSLSNQFEDQLDQVAEAEATTQGALAGASGDFELQTYGTIRGRSFNKAAVETFTATLDTNSIAKLAELQQKHWNDPAALEQEWGNYNKGVASELAKVSPEQAAAYTNRATVRGLPAVEQAKDTAYKLTRSQADAALVENEAALRAEIKANSSDLFSDNPDRSRAASQAIGMVQADYMRIYSAKDPITGKPLYSPEEVAKAKKAFTDMTMTEASLSWFDEQPDKAGAYLKFASGDFKVKLANNNDQVRIVMANRGATRNDPLQPDLQNRLKAAAAATGNGISIVVHSGGQETREEVRAGQGKRTGSPRHDHGGAADLRLSKDGQVLDFNDNRELYAKFAENAAAAGLTGIGVDEEKGYIHAGGGSKAAWGYRGGANGSEYLPEDFAQAIERGRGATLDHEPTSSEVSLSDTLSPSALNSLDAEMRSRITFINQMTDRQEQAQKDAQTAKQDRSAFEYSSRIYAAGTLDPVTGQEVKPLTREEVLTGVRNGTLKAGDGEAIMKALATERPTVSDQPTYRDILNRIYAGEDVYRMVLDAGSKLSGQDAAELLGKNQSVVRANLGEFNNDQKYYLNTLNVRLGERDPITGAMDQGKADRKASALDEYRRRVLDPENQDSPAAIADDIAARATADAAQMDQSSLARMVMPRYSVPREGQNRLDPQASAKALNAAHQAGRITDGQFEVEMRRLVDWTKLQNALDRQQPAKKGK